MTCRLLFIDWTINYIYIHSSIRFILKGSSKYCTLTSDYVHIDIIQLCFLANMNLMGSWVIVGIDDDDDDDDDDETDKIPNRHLGF